MSLLNWEDPVFSAVMGIKTQQGDGANYCAAQDMVKLHYETNFDIKK